MTKVIKKSKTLKSIVCLAAWLLKYFEEELQAVPDGQSIDDPEYLALMEAAQLVRKAERKLHFFYLKKEGLL